MERESFEDPEVAELLNKDFISIKVDKEERPDIDNIYMTVCQALNGHGGWPLTILMTPEQKPFFAGTYLPKQSSGQMLGMVQLLTSIERLWKEEREKLITSSEDITGMLKNAMEKQADAVEPNMRLFGSAYLSFRKQFDAEYGGFGQAPKFPSPHNLLFLLRYAAEYDEEPALNMVEKTLEAMFRGGMYDQIGGGFSRYSTDDIWLVPHFEKMLYDNALLVIAYAEAYQATKNPMHERAIRETLQYIMSEMTDEEGGFYCAQDADSEGEEGRYYVFSPEEVISVLGEEDGAWFNESYGITKQGNFEGKSIPNLIDTDSVLTVGNLSRKMRDKLYEYRKGRMTLHKDDKILTSWNSLMITAFAKAYEVLGEDCYLRVARKACQFIEDKMRDEKQRLFIRYRDGQRQGLGNLEDYAFYIWAQLSLYKATYEPSYLLGACKDADQMIDLFWDEKAGGFYFYGLDAERLLLRPKEVYDGAVPSGNSVAGYCIVMLAKLTRKERYRDIARRQVEFLTAEVAAYPSAYAFSLCALMLELLGEREIVCVLKDETDMDELRQLMREHYMPDTIVIPIEEHTKDGLALAAPYTAEYKGKRDESLIYICDKFGCMAPLEGMEKLKKYIEECIE